MKKIKTTKQTHFLWVCARLIFRLTGKSVRFENQPDTIGTALFTKKIKTMTKQSHFDGMRGNPQLAVGKLIETKILHICETNPFR